MYNTAEKKISKYIDSCTVSTILTYSSDLSFDGKEDLRNTF